MTDTTTMPAFNMNDPASFKLDLENPKPKEVLAIVETFEDYMRANPLDLSDKLPVKTGWNTITPKIAVQLLLRNLPGANRKIDPATVFFYANQMAKGQWKATGQPMLIDANGRLADAQHRLYADLISGATIKSYVVTDIEPIPGLFAYIDSSRPRNAATALQTSGLNGVSPIIVKVINIGECVQRGIYNPTGPAKLPRLSPAEVLTLSEKYPNAQKAARSAVSDWDDAVALLGGRKDVVAYMGMRIIDLFDEDKADDFFTEVMDTDDRDANDPFSALQKLARSDSSSDKPMKKQYMLAALIKVFNAWHTGTALGRRWMLQVTENFPEITTDDEAAEQAAE